MHGPADPPPARRRLAVLPWGDLIEDFLDPIGLSVEAFVEEMTGGWLFGYLDALATAGIDSVLICMTSTVDAPTRRIHRPSGMPLWLLPASRAYRWVRNHLSDPYAWNRATATSGLTGVRAPAAAALRHLAPYLSTPARALTTVLRQERCTGILCQEYEEARFDVCVAVGRYVGVPVFATFQGGDRQRTSLERIVRRRSINAAAGLIVASRAERDRIQHRYGVAQGRIAPIFNPLDLRRWPIGDRAEARTRLGLPRDARVAVWHGRVELWRKGLDVLLAAWAQVCAARPHDDLHLLLVGSGADSSQLRELLRDPDLRGVEWCDSYVVDRSRLRPYLDAADLYVFPSRHEGFAVAPVEAMACGLPLAAADAPGVRELVPRGAEDGGTVVPPGDAAALAGAMTALLDDPARCRELGAHARRRVEDAFASPAVGRQLTDVLAGPMEESARRALRQRVGDV
ncbi:MAG: glycosyltransferase family 4 protein [Geodermatophilaceae bacterium]